MPFLTLANSLVSHLLAWDARERAQITCFVAYISPVSAGLLRKHGETLQLLAHGYRTGAPRGHRCATAPASSLGLWAIDPTPWIWTATCDSAGGWDVGASTRWVDIIDLVSCGLTLSLITIAFGPTLIQCLQL